MLDPFSSSWILGLFFLSDTKMDTCEVSEDFQLIFCFLLDFSLAEGKKYYVSCTVYKNDGCIHLVFQVHALDA